MNTNENGTRPTAADLERCFTRQFQRTWRNGDGICHSYISLVGGSAKSVSKDRGLDLADLTFLTLEGNVDQIHYASKRRAWCGAYSYTHDEYGDMPVGEIIELVLEVAIDLTDLSVRVHHCRMGADESEGVHTYPLLKELGEMLGGFLGQVPQLQWLLDYLNKKLSTDEIPEGFDREEWSAEVQLAEMPELPYYCDRYYW
jgi:hypothetical protein